MAIHVVQIGESLWGVSSQYSISLGELVEVNGLKSTALVPGLALYIPETTIENRVYAVKTGDTLSEIAKAYGTTIGAILEVNQNLFSNQLMGGQKIAIPSLIKNRVITLAFAFPETSGTVFAMLDKYADQLSFLAIVAYSFTKEGYVYLESDDTAIVEKSKQVGVEPLLMLRNVRNGDFDAELAGEVLVNPSYRRNLVNGTLYFIRQKGYSGVSMDVEFIPPARRGDYVLFLQELKAELNELMLHVNVHAKTEANVTNRIVGGHDYHEIGKVADLVAVMTIDYGYPTGPPEPIAPLWWVDQVLRYSVQNIPPQKLQAAIPLYGYDKSIPSFTTKALSAQNAQNQAIIMGSEITYNQASAAPSYEYWQNQSQHITWFEDIRSIRAKYELIDFYQLAGVTFWQLSLSFPQNWAFVERNMMVVKDR